jgi:hypothetical protein
METWHGDDEVIISTWRQVEMGGPDLPNWLTRDIGSGLVAAILVLVLTWVSVYSMRSSSCLLATIHGGTTACPPR